MVGLGSVLVLFSSVGPSGRLWEKKILGLCFVGYGYALEGMKYLIELTVLSGTGVEVLRELGNLSVWCGGLYKSPYPQPGISIKVYACPGQGCILFEKLTKLSDTRIGTSQNSQNSQNLSSPGNTGQRPRIYENLTLRSMTLEGP